MRRLKNYRVVLCLLFMLLGNSVYAQLSLGKKSDLRDLNNKTLKVVLENNSIVDLAIREGIEDNWKLSNYEFCNIDEFNQIKGDTSYYFLVRVEGIFNKEREPGIEFISLLKGGPAGVDNIADMDEILALPISSSEGGFGTVSSYIPTYINIIQNHVLRVQRNKISANVGLAWYSNNLKEIKGKEVLINREELADNLSEESANELLGEEITIVDFSEIEDALLINKKGCVVSLSVAPEVPQMGSFCYKMLISTDTKELLYFKKQRIRTKTPKGFLESDIKAFVFRSFIG